MAIDPVCGMEVNEQSASDSSKHQGETFYFCSPGCKIAFEKNPMKYISSQKGHDSHDHHGHHHD